MLEVITCTSCGCCLGEKIPLYDMLVKKISHDYYMHNFDSKVLQHKVQWDPDWKLQLGTLLDVLGAKLLCCRVAMMGKVKYSDLLKTTT